MQSEQTPKHERPRRNHVARAAWLLGCLALALAAVLAAPAPAHANDYAVSLLREAFDRAVNDPSYSPYSSPDGAVALANNTYPTSYDLRDHGLVTSVKRQHPWGTCWAFASISAAETSIINSGLASNGLDLSERQIAWFGYTATTAEQVGEAQAGEGFHTNSDDTNAVFDLGGQVFYATSLFASGCGPISEEEAPYQNDEGYISCKVTAPGKDEPEEKSLTKDEIKDLQEQGYTVTYTSYSKTKEDGTAATWSLSSSLRNSSEYTLKESYILPGTRILDKDGDWAGLNQEGVDAVKEQLTKGRAVAVAFYADSSRPDETVGHKYINTDTWAHFNYDNTSLNHAVTIVGWDDNYSRDNFLADHKPESNGAWLVKNSWGSETEDFPNYNDSWGLLDENGKHTGYFWISYYDRSVQRFEAFDFESSADTAGESIDQYDYLPQASTLAPASNTGKISTANMFTATEDRTLTAVSCMTTVPNTTVTYDIYLLNDDATTPDDGRIVRTVTDHYDYGGYHRYTLTADEQLNLRAGQRYAVEVTQLCETDGCYYVSAALNTRRITESEAEIYRGIVIRSYTNQYLDTLRRNKYQTLIDRGASQEDAKAQAKTYIEEYQQSDEWKSYYETTIAPKVEKAVYDAQNSYFESRVNAGESWLYTCTETEHEWDDWTDLIPLFSYKISQSGYVCDNFPIKAFYTTTADWASTESLDKLAASIEEGQAALSAATISADGTDVEPSKTWLTQAEYDQYAAALDTARKQLAAAGGDYATSPAATTPSQGEVDASLEALSTSVFKPGTKQQGGGDDGGDHSGDGDGEADGGKSDGKAMPQTGDPTAITPLAAALAAGLTTLATGLRRRR